MTDFIVGSAAQYGLDLQNHRQLVSVRLREVCALLGEHPPYLCRQFPLKPLSMQLYQKVLPSYRELVGQYWQSFHEGRQWATERRFSASELPQSVLAAEGLDGVQAEGFMVPLSKTQGGEPAWTSMQVALMLQGFCSRLQDDTLMWYALVQSNLTTLYKQLQAQDIDGGRMALPLSSDS